MTRDLVPWLITGLAALLLGTVVFYVNRMIQAQAASAQPPPPQPAAAVDVRVLTVITASYPSQITGFGAAEPRFALTLSAQVAGQVTEISEAFETGRRVGQGEALLRIDAHDYRAAVTDAQLELAKARLALLEEERQGVQARTEWESSGLSGKPDSALVLRGPQREAAEAAVTQASAALASARRNLELTRIAAPFDALIVSRAVGPGSYLQAGTEVATLYSTDRLEIRLSLSTSEWANLPAPTTLSTGDWPVTLTNVEGGQRWMGRVLRAEQHLDDTTRQRALVIAVDHPLNQQPALLPGTFVELRLTGRQRDALWKLPISALSQRGEIWYVAGLASGTPTLANFSAEPVFSDEQSIYIAPPDALRHQLQRVLVHPLNGYLQGMRVRPVEVDTEQDERQAMSDGPA